MSFKRNKEDFVCEHCGESQRCLIRVLLSGEPYALCSRCLADIRSGDVDPGKLDAEIAKELSAREASKAATKKMPRLDWTAKAGAA